MSELSHKRARLLIQQKLLSPQERDALAAHLGRCEACSGYAATHMHLSRSLHLAAVRTRPAPELKGAILQRVQSQHRRHQIMNPIKAAAAVAVLAVALFIAGQIIGSAERQAAVTQPEIEAQQAEPTSRPTFIPHGRP